MERLFLTATYFEAQALLDLADWRQISGNFYQWEDKALMITGIGKKNIQKALPFLNSLTNVRQAVNLGICGGILNFELYEEFYPELILDENLLQKNNSFSFPALVSLEKPMQKPKEILLLNPLIGFCPKLGVDMEAYFLSRYFESRRTDFKAVKIFSDSGESDFFQNFKARKSNLLKALSLVAKKQL